MKKIPLTQEKFALVDDFDYKNLKKHKWFANKLGNTYYAMRSSGKTTICMHREIMKTPKNMDTDHIDGNGLNNQRENLRICSHGENLCNQPKNKRNTSGFKGVTWNKTAKKWQVQIRVKGTYFYLGCFFTPEEAYRQYCEASFKYHGDFGNLK